MDERQQRGMEIAATAKIRKQGDAWTVPSQSLNGRYTVTLADGDERCSCPDWELRRQRCKHLYAVEFVLKRETAPDGTVTETRGLRITYAQNWPAYNAAQITEKEQFCRLLRDLVAKLPTPWPLNGRPPLPLPDRLFAAAFKVYSGFSARRFSTDLRDAHDAGLITTSPHFNSVLKVIEDEDVTPIIMDLIATSARPLAAVETEFAVDSSGFGTSKFVRWYNARYKHEQINHDWIKLHICTGVKTNVVTAVAVTDRDAHDGPQFPALIDATAQHFMLKEVSADKAYSSRRNLECVVSEGARPYIPFKSNAVGNSDSPLWNKMYHYFQFNRDEFLPHYHRRSNVESTFSMIKRVFGDSVRSKTPVAQVNEALLKVLCHNIRCLIHEMHEMNADPLFTVSQSLSRSPAA